MEVSQYNHLCQVFGTALYTCHKVFNSKYSLEARFFVKSLYFMKLPYILVVDIPVDKHRCLLHAIALHYSH